MAGVQAISVAERRARLAVRHRLAPSARVDDDVAAIARSVVALHATDPLTVVLSALVRMDDPDQGAVERALYEDRTVVRMLAMRRTLWGVAVPDMAMIQAAGSDRVAADERKRLAKELEAAGVAEDGDAWLTAAIEELLAAVRAAGPSTAAALGELVPALGTRLTIAPGKPYETTVSVASRLLTVAGAEGHLVRGRPKGRWTGTHHHWTRPAEWLGDQVPPPVPADEARAALATAWLARFGPATEKDLAWWAGWPLGVTRAALASIGPEEVDLDGQVGLVLAGDVEPTPEPEPWVALLPSLDPTVMGWKQRDWYLGEHAQALFDTAGNAGPTIWVDGRTVGAWGQRRDGEIVTEVLEDIGRDRTAEVEAEVERLSAMIGDLRFSFRFTSALGKRLVS
jgi:hypothetical protein